MDSTISHKLSAKRERKGEDCDEGQKRQKLQHDDKPIVTDNTIAQLSFRSFPASLKDKVVNQSPLFPQFRKLPAELRLKIWRESWEPRDVVALRHLDGMNGPSNKHLEPSGMLRGGDALFRQHLSATLRTWGVSRGAQLSAGPLDLFMLNNFETSTWSTSKPPMSLWVNKESREETLTHYELALALPDGESLVPGGHSKLYFNFNLDALVYPLHRSLSLAFSQYDLSRVIRISVPELVPALPIFAKWNGPQGKNRSRTLPKVDDEDVAIWHPDFRFAWRALRQWFPSLREIRLLPFYTCKYYHSNEPTPTHANCASCNGLHAEIARRFPHLSEDPQTPQYDLDRILDRIDIMQPVFKDETLVIGRVAGKRQGEYEAVTVTFRAIYEGDERPNILRLPNPGLNWDDVKRRCVVKTLEHVFAPQLGHFMVYNIQQ
ncbi:uncharacterized protein F4822DRAFT_124280 [Hypoxylon trugodes]|uniref:uncharacterized protein n=1 Tax=Hypoxylon trugodes TaxID=326681 RepID=UPI00218EC4DF|nr:uncharacterized protein F4822DRAFT_124280 [Hypoxylon trugodes]KAI1392308.1 hypothetical protein F4822DRAFT_124280 [Hypoxylon trugodes]